MTAKRTYGRTKSSRPIEDEMIKEFATEAERGYEPGQLQGKPRGRDRPPLGDATTEGESARLSPDPRGEDARPAGV